MARLRAAAALVAGLEDGGGAAGAWFVDLVQQYDAGARHGCKLDELAGLIPRAGRDPWWEVEDRRRRDELLRDIAGRWFPGGSRRRQARLIAEQLGRYEATAWRRDRLFLQPPSMYRGKLREALFRVLKSCRSAPACSTVEKVLAVRRQPPAFAGALAGVDPADACCNETQTPAGRSGGARNRASHQ
jgi:hypothetical protein